mmetsp:Transcript_136574/g.272378  ORF Transcript_136574/g.272378 Transcript_136574/m.272378 type:complete len:450 (+) Transcript_136574:80-1429(+)
MLGILAMVPGVSFAMCLPPLVALVLAAQLVWSRSRFPHHADGSGNSGNVEKERPHKFRRCSKRLFRLRKRRQIEEECSEDAHDFSEHGRFKYCGLRQNPLEQTGPPQYSLEPLGLKHPGMNSDEEERLARLQQRVADVTQACPRFEADRLLRILRSVGGNVTEAEQKARQANKFRGDHDMDCALSHWDLEAYEECLQPWWPSGGFLGHGRDDQPVAYERLGACNWPRLCRQLPWDLIQKLDVVHIQRCLAAVDEDALRRGGEHRGTLYIIDVQGFGWDQVQLTGARLFAKLVQGRGMFLLDMAEHILVINAPPAFQKAWSMFKCLLDKATADKVQVYGVDYLPMLLKYISEDEIPSCYGGRRCIDGDPECRQVLAPGGPIPASVRARLQAMVKKPRATGDASRKASAIHKEPTTSSCHTRRPNEALGCFGGCFTTGRLLPKRRRSGSSA